MDFEQAIKARYSCRKFQEREIPRATIEKILEVSQHTASWNNVQPWRVLIASGEAARKFSAALVAHVESRWQTQPRFHVSHRLPRHRTRTPQDLWFATLSSGENHPRRRSRKAQSVPGKLSPVRRAPRRANYRAGISRFLRRSRLWSLRKQLHARGEKFGHRHHCPSGDRALQRFRARVFWNRLKIESWFAEFRLGTRIRSIRSIDIVPSAQSWMRS